MQTVTLEVRGLFQCLDHLAVEKQLLKRQGVSSAVANPALREDQTGARRTYASGQQSHFLIPVGTKVIRCGYPHSTGDLK